MSRKLLYILIQIITQMSFGVTQYVFVLKHHRLESFSDDESQWNIVLFEKSR
jgi:hypothetical protein